MLRSVCYLLLLSISSYLFGGRRTTQSKALGRSIVVLDMYVRLVSIVVVSSYYSYVFVSQTRESPKHMFPMCWLGKWNMDQEFLYKNKVGCLQYVVVKPLMSLLAFILDQNEKYGEGEFKADVGYPYISFVTNCSQVWAMYCLVYFYYVLKEDLAPIRPIPKFICVKAVVFFTFWQSILLAVLLKLEVIHDTSMFPSFISFFLSCMLFSQLPHSFYFFL